MKAKTPKKKQTATGAYLGKRIWNKLVRSKVPARIRQNGATHIKTARLRGYTLSEALVAKAKEEAGEVAKACRAKTSKAQRDALADELADLLEVARAIATHHGIKWSKVKDTRLRKLESNGGFAEGTFLISTFQPPATAKPPKKK